MSIERDSSIRFHELGTLTSVTRWVSSHDEGISEWLKNVRRAYQPDRANVEEKHRGAILLLKDAQARNPARIGLLDVGGATLEDVTAWSTWQDPSASGRGSVLAEEDTQGNGGKAYMYRLFEGPCRILGVKQGKLNCKGFDGAPNSLERGIPGFMPNAVSGCDRAGASWKEHLAKILKPYGLAPDNLPAELKHALCERKAFTLVEGIRPLAISKGVIDIEELLAKILRHDQATCAVQQLRLYAAHNGKFLNGGNFLELEPIAPYPGFEEPQLCDVPEKLPDFSGTMHSTTLNGERPPGKLILYTSLENMPNAYRKLKPRWKISYRTPQQTIGSKQVSELVPNTPGSQYVFATIELSALEPDYVELGRKRPIDGPMVQALDRFIAESIRTLAKGINDRRRQELDEQALDEVHAENRVLNDFKNRFLPSNGAGNNGTSSNNGNRSAGNGNGLSAKASVAKESCPECSAEPHSVELAWSKNAKLRIGRGVSLPAATILNARVLDSSRRNVPNAEVEWCSSDRQVIQIANKSELRAVGKGITKIWARVRNANIESAGIQAEVWIVDHVLLTPRSVEIPMGRKKQIIAEVTNDEGCRATGVFLNWKHDASDPLIVRIQPNGWVTGNRLGQTRITAGAGNPQDGGVWSRIPTETSVVATPDAHHRGSGFPELRLTDRDTDPTTGEIRQGDPEQPVLWQEVSDYQSNLWWLNLQSPDAAFFFGQRGDDIRLWRAFHAQKVIDMVVQVHLRQEFDERGESERPDLWARHKVILELKEVQLKQAMWDKLKSYIDFGGGLE